MFSSKIESSSGTGIILLENGYFPINIANFLLLWQYLVRFHCQEYLQNATYDFYQQGIFLVFYIWLSCWKHWTLFSFQTVQGKVGLKCECSSKKILQLLISKSRSQVLLTLIRKALDVYCNTIILFYT